MATYKPTEAELDATLWQLVDAGLVETRVRGGERQWRLKREDGLRTDRGGVFGAIANGLDWLAARF